MFWIVLLTLLVLASLAFDWVSLYMTHERIGISINIGKLTPMVRRVKEAVFGLSPRRAPLQQREGRH